MRILPKALLVRPRLLIALGAIAVFAVLMPSDWRWTTRMLIAWDAAPKIAGVTLKGGTRLKADGQLAGTPSVMFDAVALVLSEPGCTALLNDAAATDFVKDAFGHLKAIGFTPDAKTLLDKAGVIADAGIVALSGSGETFVGQARTRQWAREPKVRTLACQSC